MVDGRIVGGADEAFEFHLGRGKFLAGFDVAVKTMQAGEISEFIFSPDFAYGKKGLVSS